MKENLIHSRTCVYNINYHVVWSVKYRRKILSAEIEIYLKELVQKIACDKGCLLYTSFLWPAGFCLPNVMRAANDVKFPMCVSIASMFIFRIGLSYVTGVARCV